MGTIAYRFLFGLVLSCVCACAAVTPERDIVGVQALLSTRGVAEINTAHDAAPLEGATLGMADAVALAFQHHPKLRVAYAKLGVAAADVYTATRPSNPSIGVGVQNSSGPDSLAQIAADIVTSVTDLLTLKSRSEMALAASDYFSRQIAVELFDFSIDVRKRYIDCVADRARASLSIKTIEAAKRRAQIAQRYAEAGTIDAIDLHLAIVNIGEAELSASMARSDAAQSCIRLHAAMGESDATTAQLPATLPPPQIDERDLLTLQSMATKKLEIEAALTAQANAELGVTNAQRFRYLGQFDAGVNFERDNSGNEIIGPSFTFELPLFNQGQGRLLRATSLREQRTAELDELKLKIRSEIAIAHGRAQAERERERVIREQFLPARRAIFEQTEKIQSAANRKPFAAIDAKQKEIATMKMAISALEQYWLAQLALSRAVGHVLSSDEDR